VLGFDLLKSGIYSVLPWVTMALAANIGGWIADTRVSRGVSVTTVRKVMQTVRRPPGPAARPARLPRRALRHACRMGGATAYQQCKRARARGHRACRQSA